MKGQALGRKKTKLHPKNRMRTISMRISPTWVWTTGTQVVVRDISVGATTKLRRLTYALMDTVAKATVQRGLLIFIWRSSIRQEAKRSERNMQEKSYWLLEQAMTWQRSRLTNYPTCHQAWLSNLLKSLVSSTTSCIMRPITRWESDSSLSWLQELATRMTWLNHLSWQQRASTILSLAATKLIHMSEQSIDRMTNVRMMMPFHEGPTNQPDCSLKLKTHKPS